MMELLSILVANALLILILVVKSIMFITVLAVLFGSVFWLTERKLYIQAILLGWFYMTVFITLLQRMA